MPRVTKAMLEEDLKIYIHRNSRLTNEISNLKQINELLKQRQFDVDAFCKMHAEGVTALSHALTDLREIFRRLH